MIEQDAHDQVVSGEYSSCKFHMIFVIKSGYSCDQQKSSKNHGLSSEGKKVI